jgi:oxaloacetate decarboxylase alpha subunit
MYASSPVHTNEHWARKTRLIAEAKDCVDRIMIEDASRVITPEGTRDLVSTVQKNCDGLPIEFHSHCNSGLALLCYLEAIKSGVTTVHTAVAPLPMAPPCRLCLRRAFLCLRSGGQKS